MRNVQNLPLAKFAKINVRENLCSQKLMFAKCNVLKFSPNIMDRIYFFVDFSLEGFMRSSIFSPHPPGRGTWEKLCPGDLDM